MKETRRKFSSAFKAEVALEAIKGVKTITELAQEYQVHPVQVNTWKKTFLERTSNIFEGDKKQEQELKRLREDRDELFRQIGERKVENSWYKKTQVMNTDDKLKLVDPNCSQLSVSRQCRLLNLSRSRFYYKPKVIDEVELEQMRILDELYLEDPTRGTRRMSKELKKLGYQCGRHHTRTLMQRMRLKT